MTPARWQQIKGILADVLERGEDHDEDAAGRAAFVAERCAGDDELRREVESFLTGAGGTALERFADGAPSDGAAGGDRGRRVGAYALERELGRGGMGTVWLARRADGRFQQQVAIKLLKRGTDTEEVLRRFRAERQILARLEHPNIARLLDGGETDDGLPFLVLEHVPGVRVTEFIRAARLTLPRRLQLFVKICAAVQYAHQNLVIHRDLKPANILVTRDGEPKLLDFGIAKLLETDADEAGHTLAGHARLTPAYASPEQARGEPVTTASDIYTLGALLYELLTGQSPHRFSSPRPSTAEVARVIGEEEPTRPSLTERQKAEGGRQKDGVAETVPPGSSDFLPSAFCLLPSAFRGDLDNIVLKALEKEPTRRYPTVNALAEDIRRHLDGRPVRARPATPVYLVRRFLFRHRTGAVAAALLLLALLGGLAGTLWQAHRAEERFNDVRSLAHSVLFEFHDAIRDLPGATPARRLLVTRALEYLDRLRAQAGNDPGLRRELAAAYVQVGHVQGRPNFPNLGDTAGARVSYERAAMILEGLPDADPEAATLRADAWDALGNVLAGNGKTDAANTLQRRALALRERLMRDQPGDAARQRAVAASLVSLGDTAMSGTVAVWDQPAAFPEAQRCYERALPLRERLHADHPADPDLARELAVVHYRLGNLFHVMGASAHGDRELLRHGLEHHQVSVALREENLAAQPASGQARRNLADGLTMKSDVQTLLGDAAGALADCRRGVDLFAALAAADPENCWARQDLAFAHYCSALPQRAAGDLPGAIATLDRAIALYQGLLTVDPTSLTPVSHLNHCLRLRAEVCGELGDDAGRRESAGRWVEYAQRLSAASPGDENLRHELARARAVVGR